MSHANWQERLACQRRWRRKNRAKVRAQKRRARIKKKCLSKSLVVVLDDYRKRMSTPVTKTLMVVLDDYRLKKSPPPPPKNEKRNAGNERCRNYYQLNRERIRAQQKEYRQRNLKSVERRTEQRANVIVGVHEVPNAKKSTNVNTAPQSTRDAEGTLKNVVSNVKKSGDVKTALPSTRDIESSDEQTATL